MIISSLLIILFFTEESIVKEAEREVVLQKTESMKIKDCLEKQPPNYMVLLPYFILIRDLNHLVGLT